MSRVDEYLLIPEEYCRFLGGLRWCSGGEAVEYAADEPVIGCTFAMAGEIALFVEGFGASRPLLSFGHILHLLHLLGFGLRGRPGDDRSEPIQSLVDAHRATGRSLRNAGALCSALCREVTGAADPPAAAAVARRLTEMAGVWKLGPELWRTPGGEVPPLRPLVFEARVRKALASYSSEDLRHWLQFGRGPLEGAGEEIARQVPRDLGAILDELTRRPRLAGTAALVERIDGALTIPARRLAHSELPVGGYADLSSRGHPEHLLPTQFAIEGLEFLRRFAEHELLYYHREEPHTPAAEELLVVLDQGVRTWGDVRIGLAAAALAMGRQAIRKGLPLRLVSTSSPGEVVDATSVDLERLATWLEASDLSPNPASALARALDEPDGARRDVVLLTHPRSLRESAVAEASRRVGAGSRLFAVAVDGSGRFELSELRQGVPVALGGCRVELRDAGPAFVPPASAAPRERPWSGDVESIPFPFRLGAFHAIDADSFGFDHSGEWLLLAGYAAGLLYLWKTDGSEAAMLPRAITDGGVLARVQGLLGVAGGFVVFGRNESQILAAHYDLTARTCKVHVLESLGSRELYLRRLHTFVVFGDEGRPRAFDLAVDKATASRTPRAEQACDEALRSPARRSVWLDAQLGTLAVQFGIAAVQRFQPLRDGQPVLKGGRVIYAEDAERQVAVIVRTAGETTLYVCCDGESVAQAVVPLRDGVRKVAISRDGAQIAYPVGHRELAIRALDGSPLPRFVTTGGRFHRRLDVELGRSFLTIRGGRHVHLVRWDRGPLELHRTRGRELEQLLARHVPASERSRIRATAVAGGIDSGPGGRRLEPRRLSSACWAFGLSVLVDVFSHVVLLDRRGELVVMFYVFRDQIAAWMPDGTRLGPVPIIGGSPTPHGAERIGEALRAAQALGGGPS